MSLDVTVLPSIDNEYPLKIIFTLPKVLTIYPVPGWELTMIDLWLSSKRVRNHRIEIPWVWWLRMHSFSASRSRVSLSRWVKTSPTDGIRWRDIPFWYWNDLTFILWWRSISERLIDSWEAMKCKPNRFGPKWLRNTHMDICVYRYFIAGDHWPHMDQQSDTNFGELAWSRLSFSKQD